MATGECPAVGESSGIIGGLDHLVQLADRKIALGRQCGDRPRNDTTWCAFDGARQFCRNSAGIPGDDELAGDPDYRSHRHGVYRAGYPLRELRASTDDSLHPALGGRWALLALELFNAPFSLIALIGIMLLIGIVKKNAIMMVDFALEAQRHGNLTPQEAIFQACLLRFRPIMMTTLAALFGALPLVLSGGDGSELRQPLGITIAGGLVMSQLLTLYTTPVVYLFFDRLRLRFSRKPKQTVTE